MYIDTITSRSVLIDHLLGTTTHPVCVNCSVAGVWLRYVNKDNMNYNMSTFHNISTEITSITSSSSSSW